MAPLNALVVYKNKPAIIKEISDGKFSISLQDGSQVKVRDKDIEVIHPGPVKDFSQIEGSVSQASVREAWELLLDEDSSVSLKDLALFIFSDFTPACAYLAYSVLRGGTYFSGSIEAIVPKSRNEVEAEETKRNEKLRENSERILFLERLKTCLKNNSCKILSEDDARFIQDVEALALGKSAKSRTMKDIGLSETPEDAHSLLLKTGFWTAMVNPHPSRFGLSTNSAAICPDAPPAEDRRDLSHLEAFAIDSPWSDDPDDAVSIEAGELALPQGYCILYVHVADPASSITCESPAEKEARDRGASLYLPEGVIRMLAEDSLPLFALGLSEKSPALTFKMTINESGDVMDTEIFPSIVKVQRITYEEADREIENAKNKTLLSLLDISVRINKRRTVQGAVNIDLPEVHIKFENGIPNVERIVQYRSASIVKECMLAAGEGAASWAAERGLAFPYISQEVDIQGKIPGGLAGSYQLRRCMRPRVLSIKPARHQGLGLDTYTQVTSPLRRYTDLLSHIQIRAVLRGGKPLSAGEISARLGFCEAASAAIVQAERASVNHWLMVYLSGKKDSVWDAVALEKKGNRWAVVIPSLALEIQVALQGDVSFNENVRLILKSVNIPRGEAAFVQEI